MGAVLNLLDSKGHDVLSVSPDTSVHDAIEKMEKVNGLLNEIRVAKENHKSYALRDLIKYLDMIEEHNVLLKKKSRTRRPGAVRLMTAHKAKGLEFDYVYIVGANDRKWGNKRIGKTC